MKRRRGIQGAPQRGGVVLIVVLGILALFSLVGVMFITTAQQAQQSAQALADTDLRRDPPQALLERAMMQVLVGSTNRGSAIGPHSILEDMYGPPTLKVRLRSAVQPVANGAFLGFTITPGDTNYNSLAGTPLFQFIDNLYAGRVLTMTSGRLQGKSTRIVGWYPQNPDALTGPWTLRMIPFDGMVNTSGALDVANLGPQFNDEFLINGHPFSGMELAPNRTVAELAQIKQALNPRLTTVRNNWTGTNQGQQDNLTNPPRANEDYDAPDFNNMHMAQVVTDPTTLRVLVPAPSFHRPDLLISQSGATSTNAATLNSAVDTWVANSSNRAAARALILRPLPGDHHEDFAKSNTSMFSYPVGANQAFPLGKYAASPGTSTTQFFWDVDNDGDGEPDSVWLDLGFPISTDSQGRKFKPLFAIYVQSQDGKLNINAHGQWNDESTGQAGDPFAGTSGHRAWTEYNTANASHWRWHDPSTSPPSTWVPHGAGFSPAAVDPTTFLAQTEFFFLLHGRMMEARPDSTPTEPTVSSVQLAEPGRYGEPGMMQIAALPNDASANPSTTGAVVPANLLTPQMLPRPGRSFASSGATATTADDNFPGRDFSETNLTTAGTVGDARALSGYGSPIDLKGAGGVMIGPGGHPVFLKTQYDLGSGNYRVGRIANEATTPINADEYVDDPHEINLFSNSTALDQPFKQSDLEFILRGADADIQAQHYPGNTIVLYDSNLKASYAANSSRSFKRYHLRHGSRLRHLLSNNVLAYASHRNMLTTDSWDVTTPVRPLAAALYAKLQEAKNATGSSLNIETAINYLSDPRYPGTSSGSRKIVGPCVPFESALGVKMNLNRPWGSGVAANGQLHVVDYPGLMSQEPGFGGSVAALDRNNDGESSTAAAAAKDVLAPQMYARQLFMLAMICGDGTPTKASSTQQTATVLRLAQWAVNAVDFRDQDNIMTAFEVDLWPFTDEDGDGNPWDVDGLLNTDESGSGVQRQVVWGNELSPVLLSENFAYHDVRTKDDKNDTGIKKLTTDNPNPDPDFDQHRRPEGNLVIELYSPRNPRVRGSFPTFGPSSFGPTTWGTLAEDLYTNQTININPGTALADPPDQDWPASGDVQKNPSFAGLLDLGRAVEYNNRIDPVWRIAVVSDSAGTGVQTLLQQLAANPEYINTNATAAPKEIERLVYFAPIPAGSEANVLAQNRTYSNHIGTRLNAGATVTVNDPSMQNALGVGQVQSKIYTSNVLLGAGRFAVVAPYRETEKLKAPSGQTNTANTPERSIYVGSGATVPEIHLMSNSQFAYTGGFAMTDSGATLQPPYTSLFQYGFGALSIGCAGKVYGGTWADGELAGLSVTEPRLDNYGNIYKQPTGVTPTTVNSKSFYDQYGPLLDKPSDQTNTFLNLPGNGDGTGVTQSQINKILVLQRLANPLMPYHSTCNPYIAVDAQPCLPTVTNSSVSNTMSTVATVQRGTSASQNLWAFNSSTTATNVGSGSTFLKHSLGMVNQSYDTQFNAAGLATSAGARSLFGLPKVATSGVTADFPWIVWNNRPFANPFELMLVPAASAAMLSQEMAMSNFGTIQRTDDPTFQYKWLMPFAIQTWTAGAGGIIADPPKNLHRIFEYVGLPTAFSGGEKLFMPTTFASTGSFAPDQFPFNAPFNRLPAYREPGRVNLNAIHDASGATYEAVIGKLNMRDFRFVSSTGVNTGTNFNLTSSWGTLAQVLRGGNGEPTNLWNLPGTTNGLSNLKVPFRSYFRAMPVSPAVPPTTAVQFSQSLFRNNVAGTNPLFDFNANATHATRLDASKHAYYRYYTLQRLSQTTTVRSNVYAVWITMGNFEVEPVPQSVYNAFAGSGATGVQDFFDVYPDSYRLKGELGWDTGEIKRRRAFFIVDRTIPVGFERGRANNAFDAVTLQRIIE